MIQGGTSLHATLMFRKNIKLVVFVPVMVDWYNVPSLATFCINKNCCMVTKVDPVYRTVALRENYSATTMRTIEGNVYVKSYKISSRIR